MIPSGATHLAGALLFMDYLMSDEIQLYKLERQRFALGAHQARHRAALGPEVVERLVPQEQYAEFARPRIVGTVTDAASERFVSEILQGS